MKSLNLVFFLFRDSFNFRKDSSMKPIKSMLTCKDCEWTKFCLSKQTCKNCEMKEEKEKGCACLNKKIGEVCENFKERK